MKQITFAPIALRRRVATLTCGAGGTVAIAMVYIGGSLARFLPQAVAFYPAALIGAGLAGLLCADGFGKAGWLGWIIAALASVTATFLGAIIGSTLLGLVAGGGLRASGLGLIAILDASESVPVVVIWLAVMTLVHLGARRYPPAPRRSDVGGGA